MAYIKVPGLTTAARQAYGPHCTVVRNRYDGSMRLDWNDGDVPLAHTHGGKTTVALANLTPANVPYVNKYLEDPGVEAGFVIEKYWRTGEYRRVVKSVMPGGTVTTAAPTVPGDEPEPPVTVSTWDEVVTEVEGEAMAAEALAETLAEVVAEPAPVRAAKPAKVEGLRLTKTRAKVGRIIIGRENYERLNRAWNLRQRAENLPAGVIITGPAGTAKTLLVSEFAKVVGADFVKIDCGFIRTADDWAGAYKPSADGTFHWVWSAFAEALRSDRPTVILLDEMNRTQTPAALNALLGAMDETGSIRVPDQNEVLTIRPGVLIVATINEGREYVSTLPIDGAVRQRFGRGVRLDYPTPATERDILVDIVGLDIETANRYAALAQDQRRNKGSFEQYPDGTGISTRMLVDAARDVVFEQADPRTALEAVFAAQFKDEVSHKSLTVLLDGHFGAVAPVIEDDPDAFLR